MGKFFGHAVQAVCYSLAGWFGWPTMEGRLAQFHRAKSLPDWAVSFYRLIDSPISVDISVVITCFNYGNHLESAVKSVLEAASLEKEIQVEIIIVDDHSTDNSLKVARFLAQNSSLPILIIRPWWNVGLSKARNLGAHHAEGNFIFNLDADNTLTREGLMALHNCAKIGQSDAAYGPLRRILPNGKQQGWLSDRPFDPDFLREKHNYIDAMALFRRSSLAAVGGYDVDLLRIIGGWEDYELWLRFAASGLKVSYCNKSIVGNYLVKSDSMAQRISYKEIHQAFYYLRPNLSIEKLCHNDKLIFDLGVHRGEDTSHYLALGFYVIGVEADPKLFRLAADRFSSAINDQRLVLINAAVVGRRRRLKQSTILFYPHSSRTLWGSVDADFVARNTSLHGLPHDSAIEVPTISLEELIQQHGCPTLLKVDIEGMDAEVVEDLERLPILPEFVSWETGKKSLRQVLRTHVRLFGLGYKRFRIVQQMYNHDHSTMAESSAGPYCHDPDSSGPMPVHHPAPWRGIVAVMLTYVLIFAVYRLIGPGSLLSWAERHPSALVHYLPRRLRREMSRRHIPFPGWFDSHASLR